MYPRFIEVHGDDDVFSINVDAIQCISGNCIVTRSSEVYEVEESYEELQEAIKDCGCMIRKPDPRLSSQYLTMDELKTMKGEPVWNDNKRLWMLTESYLNSSGRTYVQFKDASGIAYIFDEDDLIKYPLYRMKVNDGDVSK